MKMSRRVLLGAVALFCALSAVADEIVGKVTKVHDGDTIWVVEGSERHKVRLDRIDAPESDQAFGKKSCEMLREKILDKTVRVAFTKRDRYGRILGIVYDGTNDVNLAMVREGGAWHYAYFDKSPEYIQAEQDARREKRGLWQEREPVNPSDFRRNKRTRK